MARPKLTLKEVRSPLGELMHFLVREAMSHTVAPDLLCEMSLYIFNFPDLFATLHSYITPRSANKAKIAWVLNAL